MTSKAERAKVELLKLREEQYNRVRYNKLKYYDPYPFQKQFHDAFDEKGEHASQVLLMAANRIGKTESGAADAAYHLTGEYPDWWEGKRFDRPTLVYCGANSNDKARDICQRALFGEPGDPTAWGSGYVPRHLIGSSQRKQMVPDAKYSVQVKHSSGGWSKVIFLTYEMGKEGWMGFSADHVWLDEEPPPDIVSQALRSIVDRGGQLKMTFTPESGMTNIVAQFMQDLKPGQLMMNATWKDADESVRTIINKRPGHLTQKVQEQILQALPPHERELRSKGIPVLGSGLVFPISDEGLMCDPVPLPDHWGYGIGMDFGMEHPTAIAWLAWDKDSDIIYVIRGYKKSDAKIPIHAAAIPPKDRWQWVFWPHDGNKRDAGTSTSYAQQYRDCGIKMFREHFTNPPGQGVEEGKGGISREAGVMEMLLRMETGRLKFFPQAWELFRPEKSMYHRKDGKIVDKMDDFISAVRYGVQMRRFFKTNKTFDMPAFAIMH